MKLLDEINKRNDIPFLSDRILRWQDVYPEDSVRFCSEESWESNQPIDLARVTGTKHPDYSGLTWRIFFSVGKRMHLNLPLAESNPSYYFESGVKLPIMSFATCDNKNYYVLDDGNHRTAIGRFLFVLQNRSSQILNGVSIYRFCIDNAARSLHEELVRTIGDKKLPLYVEVMRECIKREDGAGWKKDIYLVNFVLRNARSGELSTLNKDQLRHLLHYIKEASWFSMKWFTPTEFHILKCGR